MLNLLIDTILGWLIDFVQDLFDALFSSDLSHIMQSISAPEQLASSIPYIDVLFRAMDVIAWIFLVVSAYSVIIHAVVAQFGGDGSTENPIKSVVKIFIAAVMITYRPQVMRLVALLFSRLYGLMPGGLTAVNDLSWWSNANPVKMFTRVVLICMVAFGAVGAGLAYLERIFSFLIFMYTYPIAIAFSVNRETSDMFRQWIVGVISQMIMITLSSGMLYIAVSLLNIATNQTAGELSSAFQDSVNIFPFFLAINAMSLVKNSEKILNMYNIRTMPNQETVSGFTGAFQKAIAVGTGAAALTFNTAADVGQAMFGTPAPPVNVPGGGGPVTPSGSAGEVLPKDGRTFHGSARATAKEVAGLQGQDYAVKAAKPAGAAGIDENASVAEKLSLEKAEAPTTNQKMTAAYSRKLMDGNARPKTAPGYVLERGNGIRNFNEFSSSVDTTIAGINASRERVNAWLKENSQIAPDAAQNGVQAASGGSPLKAEDVYQGYAMANDRTLKDFKPEGFAVPVYKEGKLDGFMMKGKQTDARSGKVSGKTLYMSSDQIQKTDGKLGTEGEWTVDTSGFHQITPSAYAYDVKPSKVSPDKKGSMDAAAAVKSQAETREQAIQLMEKGTYAYEDSPYADAGNFSPAADTARYQKPLNDSQMPEQPDPEKLKTKLAEVDPGKYEAERKEPLRKSPKNEGKKDRPEEAVEKGTEKTEIHSKKS